MSTRVRHTLNVVAALAAAAAVSCAVPRPPAAPAAPAAEPDSPPAVAVQVPPAPPPVNVIAELTAAEAARARHDPGEARVHLRRVIAADPALFGARLDLAEMLLDDGSDAD